MRKELCGRLDALACSAAHAARKDARRKAQLGELDIKPAACSRGDPARGQNAWFSILVQKWHALYNVHL